MPKYIIDGIISFKYKATVEASSDIEAKQFVKDYPITYIMPNFKSNDIVSNEINPTVEVIQEVKKNASKS